jgi:hypothetical protein
VDLLFGGLLDGKGVDADLTVVGGVEALNVGDDLFAFFTRELLERRVVSEREVGAFPFLELVEEFEDFALLVAFLQFVVFMAIVDAVERVSFEAGFVDEVP